MVEPLRYVDPAAVTAYWQDAGGVPSAWASASGSAQDAATYSASEWLDRQYAERWKGARAEPTTQIRDWPRTSVADRQGNPIDAETTPQAVRDATSIACILYVSGTLPAARSTPEIEALLADLVNVDAIPEVVTTAELLAEAERALHRMLLNGGIVSMSFGGKAHTFSSTSELMSLIERLRRVVGQERRRASFVHVRRIQP